MPELPEVEVTRQGLLPGVREQVVTGTWRSRLALRESASATSLRRCLVGRRIVTVDRRAKYLLFRFADGTVLTLHLGMTGKLSLVEAGLPRQKHDHLELALQSGKALRFNDARRFGAILLWPARDAAARERAFSAREGLEPLGPDFTPDALLTLAAHRRTPLKSFLMNSHLIAGIGNIYANEILFAAGQHPERPVSSLSAAEWAVLVREAVRILQAAIAAGGSTIADFLGADGHPGYFQVQLQVYGKSGEACPVCGKALVHTVLAGRSTWFCPRCQPVCKATLVS